MWENTVGTALKNAAKSLFQTYTFLLVVVAIIAILNQRYLTNLFSGPTKVDAKTLVGYKSAGEARKFYVTVQGAKASEPSGMTEVEQRKDKYSGEIKSETVTAGFSIMEMGDRLLIIKHSGPESPAFTGTLSDIPEKIKSELVDGAEREQKGAAALFLPYMLDSSGSNDTWFGWGGWTCATIGGFLMLLSAFKMMSARRWSADISTHPAARKLARYGDPATVANEIERDLQGGITKVGMVQFASKWMLRTDLFGLNVFRLEDLAWAYQKTVQHKTNFVPTGKSFQVLIFDRSGEKLEIQMSQEEVQQTLGLIGERAPWVILGFDAEIEKHWNRDRAGFIQAVDARKLELARPPATPPPPSFTV